VGLWPIPIFKKSLSATDAHRRTQTTARAFRRAARPPKSAGCAQRAVLENDNDQ
jgi:hypothetical protein